MEKIDCPYLLNGYESRGDYLHGLASITGVNVSIVYALAKMLGPEEDFDGLVVAVDDVSQEMLLNDADNDDL
jgi:hypothetical protein